MQHKWNDDQLRHLLQPDLLERRLPNGQATLLDKQLLDLDLP